jgi:hypothetical protein
LSVDDPWPTSERLQEDEGTLTRRAARLEHTLVTLEALEAFRVEAVALRAEIQQLLAAQQPLPQPKPRRAWRRPALPDGLARILAEIVVLVTVAVVLGLLEVDRLGIVLAMGATWLVLALFETIASGALVRAPVSYAPPPVPRASAPTPAPAEEPAAEELTIVAPAPAPASDPAPTAGPEVPVEPNGDRPRRFRLRRRREEATVQ